MLTDCRAIGKTIRVVQKRALTECTAEYSSDVNCAGLNVFVTPRYLVCELMTPNNVSMSMNISWSYYQKEVSFGMQHCNHVSKRVNWPI